MECSQTIDPDGVATNGGIPNHLYINRTRPDCQPARTTTKPKAKKTPNPPYASNPPLPTEINEPRSKPTPPTPSLQQPPILASSFSPPTRSATRQGGQARVETRIHATIGHIALANMSCSMTVRLSTESGSGVRCGEGQGCCATWTNHVCRRWRAIRSAGFTRCKILTTFVRWEMGDARVRGFLWGRSVG